ncbi:hypothetical protein F2Q70_00017232 [Brassica cretica]|uniref:Uncharacterized protein n=1 Tax=Brassica cretica TaxID=69181 RepID=A0A8S9I6D2_BRACR|nr:hypothetical protein F2Q70_00017232 [Brassica cretica]
MVEPEANFGRAGRSDIYLGELVELNQSDTYISELDELSELSELSDTSLELNELSDTEEGAGLVAGRNGHFSAHGKNHKKLNLGRFYTKFDWMFGLLKKSKLQQDVYFPFKTVLEKEQMIFGNKKQFASSGFDFVQKQKNQRKRQNRFDDDEKWVRSGDRPFTQAKRSNRDVFDQNELQTYVSLEKMLHKAIHAIRQLKKKGNTNTSSAPKKQYSSNAIGSVIMLTSAKTRNRWLLWSENVETKPDKEGFSDLLPTFDDHALEPMAGSDEEQNRGHQANQERSSSIQKPDQTQGEQCSDYDSFAYNPIPFNVLDLRTNIFEEGGNDALWTVVPCQDGAQLDPTKVSPSDEATMVEPEANFGRAGRSDTYLGELVELNQSDTYISELDEPSEISDASLEQNELSDTEEEVGLVAGRNEPFSAHGKIHKKFNLGRIRYVHDDVYGDLFLAVSRLTLHPWQLAPVVQNTVFTDRSRNHPGVGSLIGIRILVATPEKPALIRQRNRCPSSLNLRSADLPRDLTYRTEDEGEKVRQKENRGRKRDKTAGGAPSTTTRRRITMLGR